MRRITGTRANAHVVSGLAFPAGSFTQGGNFYWFVTGGLDTVNF